ncbi:MAG: hypothetical protein Q8S24_12770 [Eubacteriales bacterium]|nr:hypothetical protein [Eubacteriales bacterium]
MIELYYAILGVYSISFGRLIFIAVLCSLFAASVGLLFFALASDKIKGLTYAKGMNFFILFAFSDLLGVPWLSYLSALFATFWLSGLIRGSFSIQTIAGGRFMLVCSDGLFHS